MSEELTLIKFLIYWSYFLLFTLGINFNSLISSLLKEGIPRNKLNFSIVKNQILLSDNWFGFIKIIGLYNRTASCIAVEQWATTKSDFEINSTVSSLIIGTS